VEIADEVEESPFVEFVRWGFEGVQRGDGVRHEEDDAPRRVALSLITTRGASLGPVPGDMLPSLDERYGAAVERQPPGREAVSLGGSGRTGLPPALDTDTVASRIAWIPDACGGRFGLAGIVHSASAKLRRMSGSLSQSGKKRRAACGSHGEALSGSGRGDAAAGWVRRNRKFGCGANRAGGLPCRMRQQLRARLQTARKTRDRGQGACELKQVRRVKESRKRKGTERIASREIFARVAPVHACVLAVST
jgi:hypothetical protein